MTIENDKKVLIGQEIEKGYFLYQDVECCTSSRSCSVNSDLKSNAESDSKSFKFENNISFGSNFNKGAF